MGVAAHTAEGQAQAQARLAWGLPPCLPSPFPQCKSSTLLPPCPCPAPAPAPAPDAGKKLEAVEGQVGSSGRLGRFTAATGARKGEHASPAGAHAYACMHACMQQCSIPQHQPQMAFIPSAATAAVNPTPRRCPCCTCQLAYPCNLACLPARLPASADDGKLDQVVRDSARVAAEQIKGLSTQVGGWLSAQVGGFAVQIAGVAAAG